MVKGSFFFPFRSAEARNQRRAGKKGDSLAYHVRFSKKEGEKRLKKGRRRKENWEKWKPRAFEKKAAENSCTQNGREMRRKRERRNRATESERVGNERERVIAHNNAGMHALLYFAKIIAKKSIPSCDEDDDFRGDSCFCFPFCTVVFVGLWKKEAKK